MILQANHAINPENEKFPTFATALDRPIVAIIPLSKYLKACLNFGSFRIILPT